MAATFFPHASHFFFWLLLLVHPAISQIATAVDTALLATWTTVSKSDTLTGTVRLYDRAFDKLQFTIGLIAEKTYAKVHLKPDTASGWFTGRLGLEGDFCILERRSSAQTGEVVLFGKGKIKVFPAKLLIRFRYEQISPSRMIGTITVSLDKRFFLLKKLVEKESLKTLSYMKILGKNLFEERQMQQEMDAWEVSLLGQTVYHRGTDDIPLTPD